MVTGCSQLFENQGGELVLRKITIATDFVVTADLDGDGSLDIITTRGGRTISTHFNDGGGSFGPANRWESGHQSFGVAAGDVDRDGDIDLAVANSAPRNLSILMNQEDGNFDAPRDRGADA